MVENRDIGEFFWVKNLNFDNELCGPLTSAAECVDRATTGTLPPVQTITFKVQIEELVVVNDTLIQVKY